MKLCPGNFRQAIIWQTNCILTCESSYNYFLNLRRQLNEVMVFAVSYQSIRCVFFLFKRSLKLFPLLSCPFAYAYIEVLEINFCYIFFFNFVLHIYFYFIFIFHTYIFEIYQIPTNTLRQSIIIPYKKQQEKKTLLTI